MLSSTTKYLLLFGDQSGEKLTAIQWLVRVSSTVPAVRRFLREATDVLQLELNRLGRQQHGWTKTFDSLLGMAEEYDTSEHDNIIISTALACIGRLGYLIYHVNGNPGILGSQSKPVDIIALCGGLLPASVAMAAKDTGQLFELSRETLSIGIRLAHNINQNMKLIELTAESWGRTYTGLSQSDVRDILDKFHDHEGIPEFKKIVIGVEAKDWMTLIGPPSSLKRLDAWSTEIRNASHLKTEVTGPIHSEYAPRIDLPGILGNSYLLELPIDHNKARMFSPGSCKRYNHPTFGSLLGEAIKDIAHNVLHVTDVINTCVSTLETRNVELLVMGPTNHLAAVKLALQNSKAEYKIIQHAAVLPNDNARGGSDLIAVVGMAGRFPGSETVEEFWDDLVAGKCHVKEVPQSRFDIEAFYDSSGEKKNSTNSRHGAWLDNPGQFDYRLFNVSPREAAQMDPGHRLALMIAYEALQTAGYSPESSLANGSSKIASYFGQAADEWREILNQKGADIYYVPGFSRAFGVGRLNHHFHWSGGAFSIDTACSTSLTAVSLACSALISRECDMALAGGYSVINSPTVFSGLGRAGMLSTTGGCRTYHDDADGYARAEGAGVVILKRLEDAITDNDNILAIVRGSTRMHSPTATSMTHPSAASQEATYAEVLRQSGLSANEVTYVEMHGTGTQAGDVEEMASVVNMFAKQRRKNNPLTVGAVKAAVGHGEGAAGVTSLIKTIMMLRERMIPPQPNWPFDLNQKFPPLAQKNVVIATKKVPLHPSPEGNKKIKMIVNSFDASGGNTSLAIEEAPLTLTKSEDSRKWHVVAISGRTPTSLQKNRERLLGYLERNPDTKLADLAYTTTARRMHEPLRLAYMGDSTRNITSQLRDDVNREVAVPKARKKTGSHVFLFTGQGYHYAGMGADLFRESPVFREAVISYQEMANMVGLPRFIDLISNPALSISEYSTVETQLATVALEIALAHTLKSWGIMPDIVIGHSLGEYAALCISGVLSVSDTLFLVGNRAALMEKHLTPNTYAMLVTSVTERDLEQSFNDLDLRSCSIACLNAPSVTVVSGDIKDIDALRESMTTKGHKTTKLPVPYGFHSSQLEPVLEEYQQIARGVVFSTPIIPIASTLTGRIEEEASTFSPLYLARQAREKVDYIGALRSCQNHYPGIDSLLWLEIGPKPVTLALTGQILGVTAAQMLPSLKPGDDNWKTVSQVLKRVFESGGSPDWKEFHKPFIGSVKLLNLPTYSFDTRDFWIPYAEPTYDAAAMVKAEHSTPSETRRFLTNSLQYIESESIDDGVMTVKFSSNVSDPYLLDAIKGHLVADKTICPLGVFHDMALTAASYIYKGLNGESRMPSLSLRNVDLSQALVINDENMDIVVHVTCSHNVIDRHVNVEFHSEHENKILLHGKCQVVFEPEPSWKMEFSQSFLLKSRVNSLRDDSKSGKSHRLLKSVVYQLFSNVVSYSPIYQSLEEVIMDASCNDAVGTVKIADVSGLGKFNLSPYWVDATMHLAGFVVNSGLRYANDIACLATGFDSWHSIKDLVSGETYTIYVCMQEVPNSHLIHGDCYVFQNEDLVQATLGIKFLKLNRIALSAILEKSGASPNQVSSRQIRIPNQIQKAPNPPTFREDKNSITIQPSSIKSSLKSTPSRTELSKSVENPISHHGNIRAPDISKVIESVMKIVATESGCNLKEMTDETMYADLGIDSVMAITILAKISRQIKLDLPAAFFLENESVGDSIRSLRALLGAEEVSDQITKGLEHESELDGQNLPPSISTAASVASTLPPHTPNSSRAPSEDRKVLESINTPEPKQPPLNIVGAYPALSSRVLQYQRAKASPASKVFVIADETGSTFEYIHLQELGSKFSLYGAESPLMEDTVDPSMRLEELAEIYRRAIQKEQAKGPYILGGLSAGAVIAFEIAQQLLNNGEDISGFFILDCSSSTPTYSNGGTTNSGRDNLKISSQKEHSGKVLSLCASYKPSPLLTVRGPKFSVQILAKDQGSDTEWASLIPDLQTKHIDIKSGLFLKSTTAATGLTPVLQEVLEVMTA